MPRGGSKPGERRGGRRKGTPNKKTAEMQAEIAASGETPLEYMLRILRDESVEPSRRDAMARSAAPYVHPQLSAVKHGGDGTAIKGDYTVISWRKQPEQADSDQDKPLESAPGKDKTDPAHDCSVPAANTRIGDKRATG